MPNRSRLNRFPGALLLAVTLLPGCLLSSRARELERIRSKRPATPWSVVTFETRPVGQGLSLEDLRATLEHWSQPGSGGEPRWRGILALEPADLYTRLIAAIDRGIPSITLTAYRFDALGTDNFTLVDYSDSTGGLLGTDWVLTETLPAPPGGSDMIGYAHLSWWEYPQLLLDLPVALAIGLKELLGEVVKSPLSLVEAGWIGPTLEGRSPFSPVCFQRAGAALVEDWSNGLTGFAWRFRVRTHHTPIDLLQDLAAALPLVGSWFEPSSPPPDSAPPPSTSVIALSLGIHAGGASEQYGTACRRAIEEVRPDAAVVVAPYSHGGGVDTLWSLLNLSQGMGYDLAAQLVFEESVDGNDAVELVGFSGGVQRSVAAARALRRGGIAVNQLVGVAGPTLGSGPAKEAHLLLAEDVLTDPVVLITRLADVLFFLFPSSARRTDVEGVRGHHVPFLPDPSTRAPRLDYSRPLLDLLGRARSE